MSAYLGIKSQGVDRNLEMTKSGIYLRPPQLHLCKKCLTGRQTCFFFSSVDCLDIFSANFPLQEEEQSPRNAR